MKWNRLTEAQIVAVLQEAAGEAAVGRVVTRRPQMTDRLCIAVARGMSTCHGSR